MKAQKGYYSVIQYCPDRGRAEVANVGVLVLCPESGFIDAIVTKSSQRIARVFGRGSFDLWWLRNAMHSLKAGIRHERERFRTVEDLERFIATRGNDFIFTAPRAMRIEDAQADLEKLFSELVEDRRGELASEAAALVPELDKVFRRLTGQRSSIQVGWNFEVPEFSRRIRADYYYENGVANLVRVLPISPVTSRVFNAAVKLGGESVFVEKHVTPNNKSARLTVVAAHEHPKHDGDIESQLEELFKDYPTRLVRSHDLPSFARSVENEAH